MTEMTDTPTPRWRLVAFWLLLVVLLFLHLGERPQQLLYLVTAFGDVGDAASHEMHLFAQGVFGWSVVAAVALQLRRPARQIGAAWVYGLGTALGFGFYLAFVDVPGELLPILLAALAIGVLAFLAHPSSLRAKVTPVERPSLPLAGLALVAAVPLLVYAAGQVSIHLGSGPHDEHYEFGHWIIMGAVAVIPLALALVAAVKVAGWRVPLWTAGVMVAALGVASLGIDAVSQLPTLWALLAIAWGAGFIAVGELETARAGRTTPSRVTSAPL